jgi:hypothetical protein
MLGSPQPEASKARHGRARIGMLIGLALCLAIPLSACAGAANDRFCYKQVRSPTGKNARALTATPCPVSSLGAKSSVAAIAAAVWPAHIA